MSDNSPNEFTPPGASGLAVARMSKKPLILVLLVGLILAAVLIYSVNFSAHRKKDDARLTADAAADKPLLPVGAGRDWRRSLQEKTRRFMTPKADCRRRPEENDQAEEWRRDRSSLRYKLQAKSAPCLLRECQERGADTAGEAKRARNGRPEGRQQETGTGKALRQPRRTRSGDYNPAATRTGSVFLSRQAARGSVKDWTLPHAHARPAL
jgi:type IV secretion system protein VirB10